MPGMLVQLEELADNGALEYKDVSSSLEALRAIIDGKYYDPASKLEELEELEDAEEEGGDGGGGAEEDARVVGAEGKGHGDGNGREDEEEDSDDNDFVSASNSPNVSAPSSPKGQAADGGRQPELAGGLGDSCELGTGGSEGGRSLRKHTKSLSWQPVKTRWVYEQASLSATESIAL